MRAEERIVHLTGQRNEVVELRAPAGVLAAHGEGLDEQGDDFPGQPAVPQRVGLDAVALGREQEVALDEEAQARALLSR
ncbi:MAG: hypothetical protein HYU88_12080 [Chloroflexi bacterium]|nr:hypothetical protein [Chloroflexota bacterium]